MSNQDLSDKDIARHLRAKAAKYLQMAEMLDGGVGALDFSLLVSEPKLATSAPPRPVTPDTIKQMIKNGNFRVNGIANALNVSPEVIRALIDDPANGLTDEDRGWIREK